MIKKPLNKSLIERMVTNGGMTHIYEKGLKIEAEAVEECPVKDGHLRGSHKCIRDDNKKQVKIGFGSGNSASYAQKQHDDVGLHHNVGKAKYLQDPFEINTNGMKIKSFKA
mgnify:CR=1 FL=1